MTCGGHAATVSTTLISCSKVLVVQLQRYSFEGGGKKLEHAVAFPLQLRLTISQVGVLEVLFDVRS